MARSKVVVRKNTGLVTAAPPPYLNAVGSKLYVGPSSTAINFDGFTVIAGSNRALAVGLVFGYSSGGSPPSSVTVSWNGAALTSIQFVGATYGANFSIASIWGMVAPDVGRHTLAVAWTNAAEAFCAPIAFNGVLQTSAAAAFSNSQNVNNSILEHNAGVFVQTTSGNQLLSVSAPFDANTIAGLTGSKVFGDATSGSFVKAAMNWDIAGAPAFVTNADDIPANQGVANIGAIGAAVRFVPIAGCNVQAG